MGTARHDVGEVIRQVEELGGTIEQTKGHHYRVYHKGDWVATIPGTPSDPRGMKNCKQKLIRAGLLLRKGSSMSTLKRKGVTPGSKRREKLPPEFDQVQGQFQMALKAEIEARATSQEGLGRELGLSGVTINQLLRGKQRPSVETMQLFMDTFGWTDWIGTKKVNGKKAKAKRVPEPAAAIPVAVEIPVEPPKPEPAPPFVGDLTPPPEPEPGPRQPSPLGRAMIENVRLQEQLERLQKLDVLLGGAMIGLLESRGRVSRAKKAEAERDAWTALEAWTAGGGESLK